jgi:hypothetical protein
MIQIQVIPVLLLQVVIMPLRVVTQVAVEKRIPL